MKRREGKRQGCARGNPFAVLTAALCFGMAADPLGAATYTWRGDGGTTDNPKNGQWKTAAHWMGGAPASAATNALVFKVGTNSYISTNNNGGFFKLNKMSIDLNHATNTGAIEGGPLEFVKDGDTHPEINVAGVAGAPAFTFAPKQIRTDAFLDISVDPGRTLTIGGTDKGGISGTGRIIMADGGRVDFVGNTHNPLSNSDSSTYDIRNGQLGLGKTGGKLAVNGDMYIGGSTVDINIDAFVDWSQDEQIKNGATIQMRAYVDSPPNPNPPPTIAVAELDLKGKTETIRGLDVKRGASNPVHIASASVQLGQGQLKLTGDYSDETKHEMNGSLTGARESILTKAGANYTWTFNGGGSAFRGSVIVEKGLFELAKNSQLGTAENKCKGVTIKKGAKKNIAGKVNCKVTEESPRGEGPTPLGLTVEAGGRLVPKSQSDEDPPEDPEEPPAPFDAPGIGTALEVLLAPGSILEIQIDGHEVGHGFGYYSQLNVLDGPAIIDGSHLQLLLTAEPLLAQQYMILKNDGIGSTQGSFAGKPQGSFYTAYYAGNPYIFQVDYFGGDGNDVVLTSVAVPEPATAATMILGLALGARRRRRLDGAAAMH